MNLKKKMADAFVICRIADTQHTVRYYKVNSLTLVIISIKSKLGQIIDNYIIQYELLIFIRITTMTILLWKMCT